MNRLTLGWSIAFCSVIGSLILSAETTAQQATIPVSFQTKNGWTYDGKIELPPSKNRQPWAVMLLGGGISSGMNWEVPGLLTIDGKETRDARKIANAFLAEGFMVMRWQAIRRDDPLHAREPYLLAETADFEHTVEQANLALATFRAKKTVPDNNIFLIGHSLGARRAAIILDENRHLPGIVSLAGASLVNSNATRAMQIADEAVRLFLSYDSDRDQKLSATELKPSQLRNTLRFDLDADGQTDVHEFSMMLLNHRRDRWDLAQSMTDQSRFSEAAKSIGLSRVPTYCVVGSLDKRWLIEGYLMTIRQMEMEHPDYCFETFENLGHQLGPELAGPVRHERLGIIADARVGSIDDEVVRRIVQWVKKRAEKASKSQR